VSGIPGPNQSIIPTSASLWMLFAQDRVSRLADEDGFEKSGWTAYPGLCFFQKEKKLRSLNIMVIFCHPKDLALDIIKVRVDMKRDIFNAFEDIKLVKKLINMDWWLLW
jgi:hypothetical protein